MIQLWLDDLRPAPDGWVWAKNVQEAKDIFLTEEVIEASLDHDLGVDEALANHQLFTSLVETLSNSLDVPNGYDFVKWMAENELWPERLSVHSANPVGARSMAAVIDSRGPYYKKYQFTDKINHTWGWLWKKS